MNTKNKLIPPALIDQVADRFKILSDTARLSLLSQLHIHGELCVTTLVTNTGHRQASVSKHMRQLTEAGMVARRKEGLKVYYRITDPSLSGLCLLVCGQLDIGN